MGKYIFDAILTPEEDGGYSVAFPTLPGCLTCGDDYRDAAMMAADAAKTWVSAKLTLKEEIPEYRKEYVPEGSERLCIFFEVDESYLITDPVISAAQAARELNVSAGRITQMLNSGLLEGYRKGRHTWITEKSVDNRKANPRAAGRPRRETMQA